MKLLSQQNCSLKRQNLLQPTTVKTHQGKLNGQLISKQQKSASKRELRKESICGRVEWDTSGNSGTGDQGGI